MPFGIDALDDHLGCGGLRAGALHEATALTCSLVDDAAATLFLAGIAAREACAAAASVLWVSCRNDLYAPGLEQAGLASTDVIHAQPRDDAALLAVVEDAVRDGTPAAVVAEASKVSMIATRRLQLLAAEADIPVLLLRRHRGRDRDPFPTRLPPGHAGGFPAHRPSALAMLVAGLASVARAGWSNLPASGAARAFP